MLTETLDGPDTGFRKKRTVTFSPSETTLHVLLPEVRSVPRSMRQAIDSAAADVGCLAPSAIG